MSVQKTHREASPTPATGSPFMVRAEVLQLACISPSTLYAWMAAGHFPSSISLGPKQSDGKSGKAVWIREEVMAWLRATLATSRTYTPAQPMAALGASQPA